MAQRGKTEIEILQVGDEDFDEAELFELWEIEDVSSAERKVVKMKLSDACRNKDEMLASTEKCSFGAYPIR